MEPKIVNLEEQSDQDKLSDDGEVDIGSLTLNSVSSTEQAVRIIEPSIMSTVQSSAFSESQTRRKKPFWRDLENYTRDMSETVEVHGIRYLFEEDRSLFERIFWSIVLTCTTLLALYFVVQIYQLHHEHKILVDLDSEGRTIFDVPFPSLTICSCAKAHKFNFSQIHERYQKYNHFDNAEDFEHYQYYFLVCDRPLYMRNVSVFKHDTDDLLEDNFYETMKKLSPSVDEIMIRCSYNDINVKCSDIFKPVYTNLGLCYSFNLVEWKEIYKDDVVYHQGYFESEKPGCDWFAENGTMSDNKPDTYPRRGFQTGAQSGLSIFLKQDLNEVDFVCTSGLQGFRFTVDEPIQPPNLIYYYIPVSLHSTIMVQVKAELSTTSPGVAQMPIKERGCYLSHEKQLRFFQRYTKENCLSECLSNFTKNYCGCVPFYLPRDKSTKLCGVSKLECVFIARNKLEISNVQSQLQSSDDIVCDCKPHCFELKYVSDVYHSSISKNQSINETLHNNRGTCHFHIFFKSKNLREFEKKEFASWAELFAHIGEVVNLFLGSSVLTFIEIIYVFTLKIFCNKFIYGPWAGPLAINYRFD